MYKEKFEELKNRIIAKEEKKEDNLYYLEDAINSCGAYVESIITMEALLQLGRFRMDGEAFKEQIERLNGRRTSLHNSCIISLNIINKLCMLHDMETIFPGLDAMDRTTVADTFVKGIVDEYFKERTK